MSASSRVTTAIAISHSGGVRCTVVDSSEVLPSDFGIRSMRKKKYTVRVTIARAAQDATQWLDIARRQADYLGWHGIKAKAGQKDRTVARHGALRLVFPTRALATAYKKRVDRLGIAALSAVVHAPLGIVSRIPNVPSPPAKATPAKSWARMKRRA